MEWLFRLIDRISGKQAARQDQFAILIAEDRALQRHQEIRLIRTIGDALNITYTGLEDWSDQRLREEVRRLLAYCE